MENLRLNSCQSLAEVEPLEALHWVHASMSFQVCINAECVDMEKTYKSTNCSLKCKGHAVSLERRYPQFNKPYAISVLLWWGWTHTLRAQRPQLSCLSDTQEYIARDTASERPLLKSLLVINISPEQMEARGAGVLLMSKSTSLWKNGALDDTLSLMVTQHPSSTRCVTMSCSVSARKDGPLLTVRILPQSSVGNSASLAWKPVPFGQALPLYLY